MRTKEKALAFVRILEERYPEATCALEYEGDVYLALAEPEEEDAVFFLKIEQDADGSDVYTAPDEALEDALFEQFIKQREQDDEQE